MRTTHYDEQQFNEGLRRFTVPVFMWALLFALFAFGGALSDHEPTQTADAASAVRPIAAALGLSGPTPSDHGLPDTAFHAHEALDPAGGGLTRTP